METVEKGRSEFEVELEPLGRREFCLAGESILDCLHRLGVDLTSVCGGKGKCHACKVKLLKGKASLLSSAESEAFTREQIEAGWRLACQAFPASPCKVFVPPESMIVSQRVQVEGLSVEVALEPPVKTYRVDLTAPSLSQLVADADGLLDALNRKDPGTGRSIDIDVIRNISPQLRSWDWRCSVFARGDEVVSIAPQNTCPLGLAVDLGSTKIAGYLVDLSTGRTLKAKGVMNPQISYGEDIITRISQAMGSPGGGKELQEAALNAINQMALDLCKEVDAHPTSIMESVIVGNTAMHHLLLCLPVEQLALSPYVPAVRKALDIKARDVGLQIAPGAYTHILPNVAGFVGADHVAMLLATEAEWSKGIVIAMDIGTNTEVSLVNNGQIVSASCASGPAFEGYHIKDGVRASKGAIEKIRVTRGGVQYDTIDGAPPIGICGSGILDAMAQLLLAGVIDRGGRMIEGSHPRVRTNQNRTEFVVVDEKESGGRPPIVITQKDIRELQLAKAAIRSGVQILLQHSGVSEQQIDKVVIAGAFGSYIDLSNSIAIGLLPSLPLDRFKQVGNAAGTGAKLALVSMSKRSHAGEIGNRANYIELATYPKFQPIFIQACNIGPYQATQWPSP